LGHNEVEIALLKNFFMTGRLGAAEKAAFVIAYSEEHGLNRSLALIGLSKSSWCYKPG